MTVPQARQTLLIPTATPSLRSASVLRVALVITGLETGGAEAMLERLLPALSPEVQTLVVSLSGVGVIGRRLQERGFEVVALGMQPGRPSVRALLHLMRCLRSFRPDVVHTWMYHADLMGGLAARLVGIRGVMWGIHQSNLDPALNRRLTLLIIRLCALLSRWVPRRIACAAVRARDAHIAVGYDAGRMLVIPNGFDLSRFKPDEAARSEVRAELGLPATAPLIGVIGRFHPQKNHRGFCDTMAAILQQRSDVHALLAGEGIVADNAELMGWLTAAGVRAHCHLLGPRSDIPRLMAALDVLVLPSWGEAFPNVVGEAMACGVPCAVTDVGDTAMMVGALGRVVAAGDARALAEATIALLDVSPAERVARAVQLQDDIRRRFEIGLVARTYEQAYRSVAMGG